jgi:hypothetical protein
VHPATMGASTSSAPKRKTWRRIGVIAWLGASATAA